MEPDEPVVSALLRKVKCAAIVANTGKALLDTHLGTT
jgi:hypothetical protein